MAPPLPTRALLASSGRLGSASAVCRGLWALGFCRGPYIGLISFFLNQITFGSFLTQKQYVLFKQHVVPEKKQHDFLSTWQNFQTRKDLVEEVL